MVYSCLALRPKHPDPIVRKKGFSPATISAYRTDLLQFEGWLHREQHSLARPGELEKYHFQDYSAHLFHEGQARSSIGRKLSALRSL